MGTHCSSGHKQTHTNIQKDRERHTHTHMLCPLLGLMLTAVAITKARSRRLCGQTFSPSPFIHAETSHTHKSESETRVGDSDFFPCFIQINTQPAEARRAAEPPPGDAEVTERSELVHQRSRSARQHRTESIKHDGWPIIIYLFGDFSMLSHPAKQMRAR